MLGLASHRAAIPSCAVGRVLLLVLLLRRPAIRQPKRLLTPPLSVQQVWQQLREEENIVQELVLRGVLLSRRLLGADG